MKKLILRDLSYKNLHIVNPKLMLNLDQQYDEGRSEMLNEVYVFVGFMKPGRQCYAVAYPHPEEENTFDEMTYYTHKMVVPHRIDDVVHFVKPTRISKVVRLFDKAQSVFADWIEDGPDTAKLCIDHDLSFWNGSKFIKDEEDYERLVVMVYKYAEQIKNIFIQLASKSQFPQYNNGDFRAFSTKTKIPDSGD